jgi:hypothetical protein
VIPWPRSLLARTVVVAALVLPFGAAPTALARVDLGYGGGPVLHHNRTHLIFWQPAGSGLSFDPGYMPLVEQFATDVAASSRSTSDVLGITGQYADRTAPAASASAYAGAVLDTDPLPPSHCVEPVTTGPTGWLVCLTDAQLQTELQHVIASDRLPVDRTQDVYVLLTPRGFGDCSDSSSSSCALGGSATGYCGYHSSTAGGLIYAVIPYNAVPGHCQSGNPRPNSSTADPALSTVAHELAEAVTDPFGDGWADRAGGEIADLCITSFGPALGGSGTGRWNEVLGAHHYWLQELWSRVAGGCAARPAPDRVSFSAHAVASAAGSRLRVLSFRARGYVPGGRTVGWLWSFGDGRGGHGALVRHVYRRPGRYTVRLRLTDSAGDWTFVARSVRVTKSG